MVPPDVSNFRNASHPTLHLPIYPTPLLSAPLQRQGYTAGLQLTDKGDTVKGGYSHVMATGQTAALEVTHALKSSTTTFTVGYARVLQNKALAKVKLDNNGMCGVLYETNVDPMTKLCLSGSFNATNLSAAPKYGMSVTMNN